MQFQIFKYCKLNKLKIFKFLKKLTKKLIRNKQAKY